MVVDLSKIIECQLPDFVRIVLQLAFIIQNSTQYLEKKNPIVNADIIGIFVQISNPNAFIYLLTFYANFSNARIK